MAKNRPLRSGYTTGACAAAAAQAAATSLLQQASTERVEIELPAGKRSVFQIHSCAFDRNEATCSVIKDAGDDPDVTHRAEIRATISWDELPGVHVQGGEGIGVVTKPGLEIPIGSSAINPVPRQMIVRAVNSAVGGAIFDKGVRVTISVPNGAELAKKTLNSRLGIIGGISILGTTGIVIPYSVSAYTACISQALKIAVACGQRTAVLTTGRRSEKFAQAELKLPDECYIQAGDFIGFSLRESVRKGIDNVVVWSMIGKTTKIAAGNMYTNVSNSQVDIGFMRRMAVDCGVPGTIAEFLSGAITANHFRKLMPAEHMARFGNELCRLAAENCRKHVDGKLNLECIMTDPDGKILGRADAAR